jgi:hypothetical protein
VTPSDTYLAGTRCQGLEERRVHDAVGQVAGSDSDVGAAPQFTVRPYLDLGTDEGLRRNHDGCSDVLAEVEHDCSGLRSVWGDFLHGYGAADDTGVILGFE